MEDVVYTLPDSTDGPFTFHLDNLPKADNSSGVVRFRTATPKQYFTQDSEESPAALAERIRASAQRHYEIAADHLAAALWLLQEAPIKAPPSARVTRTDSRTVTILTEQHVRMSDFHEAARAAGVYKGSYPSDVKHIMRDGKSGDGRYYQQFEVTYQWVEYAE